MSDPLIRYVADGAGRKIAWTQTGTGTPPILCLSAWASHLTLDWTEPAFGSFYRRLARRRRLIRFDRPGVGLSDRDNPDFGLEAQVDQINRVLRAAAVDKVALMGRSMSGPIAIAYAAAHPDRVSHLVLFATGASMVASESWPDGTPPALATAVEMLLRADWGLGARTVTEIMLPGVDPAQASWYTHYQQMAATGQVMGDIVRHSAHTDVSHLLREVSTPTLVIHRRNDRATSLTSGVRLAQLIPGAQLRILEGDANLPFFGDIDEIVGAVDAFLNPGLGELTERELEVIRGVAEGLSNQQIGAALHISQHTAARHLANVYIKLGVNRRTAAVARAIDRGLVERGPRRST